MMGYGYGGYDNGMMGGIAGIFMFLVMLFFLVAVVFGFIALMKNTRGHHMNDTTQEDNAMKILNERYAMGEVSDEEYNKRKTELKKR